MHSYEYVLSSMQTGLVPLLDRLQRDVETYAPADARDRLKRIAIPEWNAFGGWSKPLSSGTAIYGALADSRTLHVLARRPEVVLAMRLALAAPFPDPPLNAGAQSDLLDVRPGYIAVLGRNNGAETVGTAVYEMGRVWGRALRPQAVRVEYAGMPTTEAGVSVVDATAFRTANGGELNLVITNGSQSEIPVTIVLQEYAPDARATLLTVRGNGPLDNNTWADRGRVLLREEAFSVGGASFVVRVPPFAVVGLLMTGAVQGQ